MTPEQFRTIRINAGLSINELADVLRISDGRSIRRYEDGSRTISGPIALHMERIANGQFDAVQWQPIESAPMDEWVLITGGNMADEDSYGKFQPSVVSGLYFSQDYWTVAIYDGGYSAGYNNPTHWMPLPEPPQ